MANKYLEKIALNRFEQHLASGTKSPDPRVQDAADRVQRSQEFSRRVPNSHVEEIKDLHKDFNPILEGRGKLRSVLGSTPVNHFKNVGDNLAKGAPSVAKKLALLARMR
jgi:hypothetical protein